MSALLDLDGVTKRFGGVVAVDELSFAVAEGDVLGIIGPNGAGKTTLLSLISAAQRPSRGRIVFDGRHRLERLRPHAVARLGIARAHQVPRPFHGMTVRQNVMVAAQASGRHAREHAAWVAEVFRLCGVTDVDRQVESLRLLELKRLGVARALALDPKLLLLDEVAAGLVGDEVSEIVELIRSVRERGVTVILVEHVQALIQELAGHVIVLDWGRKVAEGAPVAVASDPEVIRIYLGDGGGHQPARRVRSKPAAEGAAAGALLAVDDLTVEYGKARALRGVSIAVAEGELVAVVGANGAGKTSLALAIAGMVRAAGARSASPARTSPATPPMRGRAPGSPSATRGASSSASSRSRRTCACRPTTCGARAPRSRSASSGSTSSSPRCASARVAPPPSCRAVSSRWSPSAGRSCRSRAWSSSTSCPWASRPR
jgi:branched-chain amino acid transport system ATP-binding protein